MTDSTDRRQPARALLVEDSLMIALNTEEALLDLGVDQVTVCDTATSALEAIDTRHFDFALLDCHLGDHTSAPVGERLKALGVPFWLATGYDELDGDMARLGCQGVIIKPYGTRELTKILAQYTALSRAP